MKDVLGIKKRRNAQTLVFFLLAWGTIMLLAGLAIDSGLLYLAKARMGRAVDGAALAAVGNFNRDSNPVTNRDDVAVIMRNFAVANFTDLSPIATTGSATAGGVATSYTLPNGTTGTSYTYSFNDGTQDANGAYRRFVQVVLNTGSGGAITSATCNARCPVQTYFIGYATYAINGRQNVKIGGYSGPTGLMDLKVSSSAIATRNPRLIMVVIDRSASMLEVGGGASGLPPAIVQFLDFFDTTSDNIGIVSFGSSARLEMPLTTNFIIAGTNNLIDSYETNGVGGAEPGTDPESIPGNTKYDPNYNSTGVRRLKFGGDTAADDGIRLGLEQLLGNSGFNDPDVVKYMVIFTDGKWNASRTLVAAPGYTNTVTCPTASSVTNPKRVYVTNTLANLATNGANGLWVASTDLAVDTNLFPVPTLSPMPTLIPAIASPAPPSQDYVDLAGYHTNDTWISKDASGMEPVVPPGSTAPGALSSPLLVGAPINVVTASLMTNIGGNTGTNYYTHNLDVWLQPGAVDYVYNATGTRIGTFVSDYTNPDNHINVNVPIGGSNVLVVPGYIADGVVYDGLDLGEPDNDYLGTTPGYSLYQANNFQDFAMWPDDSGATNLVDGNYYSASLQRNLMFRNYPNLLTGFYVFRPDEPVGSGFEPLITEQNPPGAPRSRYGLGAYYPSAGFYWPFGGETDVNGYVTNAVGLDPFPTFGLENPNGGGTRHLAYSINMLSTAAAPEWAGELFYKSSSGGGTNTISTTTAASEIMQSDDWKVGAPPFVTAMDISGLMVSEATHNTNIVGSPSVWRPVTFNGSNFSVTLAGVTPSGSATGGYVSDGLGHYFKNAMAWSGRPTHYFDFSQSKWVPIANNHVGNIQFYPIGNWKAQEYAWHARALGVTIFTVGYGQHVLPDQQVFLAQIANATNTTAGGGSNISFNANQPIGQQFYATNATQISNDFFSVGQAINAALTQ